MQRRHVNSQGVTSVKGETDQAMLMGWNRMQMVCKMGCHCGWYCMIAIEQRFTYRDSHVLYKVKLLLMLELDKYDGQ